jgi:AhpD family alkylhydroperoxidase
MARLPIAKPRRIDLLRRLTYAWARRMYGQLPEPAGVIAHHRPLLAGYSAIGLAHARYSRAVPRRLKELAMLRSAQLIGCEWCLDFGSRLAADAGIPEADLRELAVWRSSPRFDELDRLVLEYTEQMTRTPVEVSDELFGQLAEHFDERAIVELTMTIALENLYSRSNWALGIDGQGFSEGTYCVRPAPEHGSGALVGDSRPR